MNDYLKEIKAIIIFALIVTITFGFIFLITYFNIEKYFYQGIIYYISSCALLAIFSSFFSKFKFLKKITDIVLAPVSVIYVILTILLPFGYLIIYIMLYGTISYLVPELLFKVLNYFDIGLIKNNAAKIYAKLTLSVFIAVLFNYQLKKLIYIVFQTRFGTSEKLKQYELDKLTDYLLSENNIRFLIYGVYVVLLLFVNLYNFEGKSYTSNTVFDKAILQSFVTFIAFERALPLLKSLEFKPSDLLNKIAKSIINKFNSLDEKQTD